MTLGVSLVGVTKLVDMTMVLRRLQAIGYTEQLANKAYGSYTTLALSVFALLPTLLNSISLPLVPSLCGAIAQGDMEKQAQLIRICYRLTAVFAIPAALVISAFARPILLLLFGYDAEAVSIASPLLSYLGVSVFLSCMITATNAVLHSYKIVNRPIFAMLAGAVIKIVSAYFLIGNPGIGLLGAPMSTFLCNLTIVMLNLAFVARFCDVNALLRYFLRPLLAATGAVGVGFFIYVLGVARVGEGMLLTLLSLATVAVSYLLLACLTGAIRSADVQAMPMGGYLNQILVRLRLIRQEEQL